MLGGFNNQQEGQCRQRSEYGRQIGKEIGRQPGIVYSLGKEFESYSTDKGKPLEYLEEVNYMIKFR